MLDIKGKLILSPNIKYGYKITRNPLGSRNRRTLAQGCAWMDYQYSTYSVLDLLASTYCSTMR
jgi:hypothetical protein